MRIPYLSLRMKLITPIFIFIFLQNFGYSQEIIHYKYLENYSPNCNESKTKSDSAYCKWLQSEEDLNVLRKIYSYCPDSLKNISQNNCSYINFDTLINCVQNEVRTLLADRLEMQKTDEDRSILYYEYLSIFYDIRRMILDDFLYSKGVYKVLFPKK